ncbi:MAG: hypothetical protein NTX29_17095 [Actinobacteria bacterium]|nr:hypothetical protein [Actinomycetota bacterium]
MVKDDARTYDLLRQRDVQKRSRQVWAGITVIWAVVLGWVLWGFINALTDVADSWVVWLVVYLLPVLALAIVTLLRTTRIRSIDAQILAIAEHRQHPDAPSA